MAGDYRDVPPRIPVVQLLIDLAIGVIVASGLTAVLYAVGRVFWRWIAVPLVLLVLAPHAATAATYYINGNYPRASNTATGKAFVGAGADTPWRSVSKANATLVAGDTVIILSLNPADSTAKTCVNPTNPLLYHNRINPRNSGSGYADAGYPTGGGPIVYWGADSIANEPLNLPISADSIASPCSGSHPPVSVALDRKNYIVIRGVNLKNFFNLKGSGLNRCTGIKVQACSLRTWGYSQIMKLEGAKEFRMDSCSARFKQVNPGSGYNFCVWFENTLGGFGARTSYATCEDDTFRFNSMRFDSIRFGDNWAMRFKFYPARIWFLNNNIEITIQPNGSSGGQQPHGIVHEESHYIYWYNNNVTFIAKGIQGAATNETRLWVVRSGTRRCRFQNNTIRVYNTEGSPHDFDYNLSQHSEVITASWDEWYGDHSEPKYNTWLDNRFYINTNFEFTDPRHGGMKWETSALKDSFCRNIVYVNGGTPLMFTQAIDSMTITQNTLFSDSSFAIGVERSGCTTPFSGGQTIIRNNAFVNSKANAIPILGGTDSCGVLGVASPVNVMGLDSFSPLLTMTNNLFFSQRTKDSTSAIGYCGGTPCPISPTPGNRWANPAFTSDSVGGSFSGGWATLNFIPTSTLANRYDSNGRLVGWYGVYPCQYRPEEISTLAAGSPTSSSARLTWIATGNDSTIGRALLYDVRYTTDPEEFDRADMTEASNEPIPATSGASEVFTVEGLAPATTYYFHIWVINDRGNYSEINTGPAASVTTTG